MKIKFNYLVTMLMISAVITGVVHAREYTFDKSFIFGDDAKKVNLQELERNSLIPGEYFVNIVLNDRLIDSRKVVFILNDKKNDAGGLIPCIPFELLPKNGVDVKDKEDNLLGDCINFERIPQSKVDFDINSLTVFISIPQVYLSNKNEGIEPISLWDDGMPALLMNYNYGFTEVEDKDKNKLNNQYLQVYPGFNVGAWRFRNISSWNKNENESGDWESAATYLERGIYPIESRLTIGESYTNTDIFDSVPFTGIMLGSDEDMMPPSERGYAPSLRGIANTQAKVEVRQNGYTVYTTTVAPGAFDLTNSINIAYNSSDLELLVFESDGTIQRRIIPYSIPAISVKSGGYRYSAMAGNYRSSNSNVEDTPLTQITFKYGLPQDITLYSGGQISQYYKSLSLGMGLTFGYLGAVSLDVIGSQGEYNHNDKESGNAWRIRYNKYFSDIDTAFTLASYQMASKGFSTINDVLNSYDGTDFNQEHVKKIKDRSSIYISKNFDDYGSFSVNGYHDSYWGDQPSQSSLGVSYSTMLQNISLSLDYVKSMVDDDTDSIDDESFTFNVSIPLNSFNNNVNGTYRYSDYGGGESSHMFGLRGDAFSRQLNWNVEQSVEPENSRDNNSYASATWFGSYAQVGSNYSYTRNSKQYGMTAAGSLVAHAGGVTLSQPLGSTNALISIPEGDNISVLSGMPGAKTDIFGNTVIGFLNPYQKNVISIDTLSNNNVSVKQPNITVVPTKGAIVKADFYAVRGHDVIFIVKNKNGEYLSFGSVASFDGEIQNTGIVGDSGELYLTGLPDSGSFNVRWGRNLNDQCNVNYSLNEYLVSSKYTQKINVVCL